MVTRRPSCLSYPGLPGVEEGARCDSLAGTARGPVDGSVMSSLIFQGMPGRARRPGRREGVGEGGVGEGVGVVWVWLWRWRWLWLMGVGARRAGGCGRGRACPRVSKGVQGRERLCALAACSLARGVVHPGWCAAAGGDRALVATMADACKALAHDARRDKARHDKTHPDTPRHARHPAAAPPPRPDKARRTVLCSIHSSPVPPIRR